MSRLGRCPQLCQVKCQQAEHWLPVGSQASVALMVLSNFILSSILLFKGDQGNPNWVYNIGSRTTTGLLTNTMLVSTRVYGYLSYARTSRTNKWAISLFSVIPTSYNTIDENAKVDKSKPDDMDL